ncbi:MAG: hypothetical protein EOP06_32000 [Proteobacteria bacterium]|nr:MAG: hypothetical protein EOP06_32000 [Pseudomonadota bacterium]
MDVLSIIGQLIKNLFEAMGDRDRAVEAKDLEGLALERQSQELSLPMLQLQAKVAQEVAIATRIENAEEVEIEEYFEGSGEGTAGVKNDANSLTLGMAGSGRKVVKRVYKFKGAREPSEDTAEIARAFANFQRERALEGIQDPLSPHALSESQPQGESSAIDDKEL